MEAAKAVFRPDDFKAGEGVLLERDFGLRPRPEQASQVAGDLLRQRPGELLG